MKFQRCIVAAAVAACIVPAQAEQGLRVEDPGKWGFSAARLERIAEVIDTHTRAGDIGGAVTLVARKGHIVYLHTQGLADIAGKKPVREDTIFVLASMTKPVTGVAIMMLLEEGKLRLTDPISKFLPEFRGLQVQQDGKSVPANREVTIVDLLTHTSGHDILKPADIFPPRANWPAEGDTLATFIPRLAAVKLDFQPGTRWSYSGVSGIDILSRIVEVASGMSLDAFFQKRIFQPLGMKDTSFVVPPSKQGRVAIPYDYVNGQLTDPGIKRIPLPETYFSGSAGLLGTVEDYWRFAQMLGNGGVLDGKRLLSPRAVELMSANYVGGMMEGNLGRGKGVGFGLTMEVITDPALAFTYRSKGCFGWDGKYGTQFWVDPAKQVVAVCMVQSAVGWRVKPDVDMAIMQALEN